MDTAVGVGIAGILVAILIWIVVGLVMGMLARFLMPGPDPMSVGRTILLGIAGSFIGGILARLLKLDGIVAFLPMLAGAMLLLWIGRRRRRASVG